MPSGSTTCPVGVEQRRRPVRRRVLALLARGLGARDPLVVRIGVDQLVAEERVEMAHARLVRIDDRIVVLGVAQGALHDELGDASLRTDPFRVDRLAPTVETAAARAAAPADRLIDSPHRRQPGRARQASPATASASARQPAGFAGTTMASMSTDRGARAGSTGAFSGSAMPSSTGGSGSGAVW